MLRSSCKCTRGSAELRCADETLESANQPLIQVTRITDDISDEVAGFLRKTWANDATGDRVRGARAEASALNPAFPGEDIPAVVYLLDCEVIGHLGTVPVKFWNGRTETPGHWLRGFMVLPEHRNGPVGFALLREMLKHVDVSGIMTVTTAARRLFKAVGYVECGVIPNFISLLRPERVASSIDIANLGLGLPGWAHRLARFAQTAGIARTAGKFVGVGLRAWRSMSGSTQGLTTDLSGSLPSRDSIDDLWSRARPTIPAGAVRDGSFLSWRYDPRAQSMYEAVAVFEPGINGRLVALAIVRRPSEQTDPRLRGIKVATLADILYRPDDQNAALAALTGAEHVALRMGADAILCSAAHPAITSVLRRRAYARLPGNVHLMISDARRTLELPMNVDSWWVTRGDAHSDGTF